MKCINIHWFNPDTFMCPSQGRTWISNLTGHGLSLCLVSPIKVSVDCLFCWHWWYRWPSLFQISFHKLLERTLQKPIMWRAYINHSCAANLGENQVFLEIVLLFPIGFKDKLYSVVATFLYFWSDQHKKRVMTIPHMALRLWCFKLWLISYLANSNSFFSLSHVLFPFFTSFLSLF